MSNVETTTTNENVVPAHGKNDKRLGDFTKAVRKLGEEASLGRDSLPKLAQTVVRAASDGIIEPENAEKIYEDYARAEGKKAVHEHSAGGKKANVSKLRQLIAMGCNPKVDGVEVMQDAFEARNNMIADSMKVKAAYAFYVDVARAQAKTDDPLSKEFLEELAVKPEPNAKTIEGELKKVEKILEALVTGENRDKLQDDDELTEAAFQAVRERIEKLQMMEKQAKLRREAAKLGLTLA